MTRQSDQNDLRHQRIKEIARTIGVPATSFYEKESDSAGGDLPALARLFAAINDVEGRQRVIDVARREAGRCRVPLNLSPE